VEKALEKVPGVSSVKALDKETRGCCRFEVTTEGDVETREALFNCVVKNKWVLTQMTPVGMSLEDVFLKLTTKEAAA
jgi:copper chaperone CopZ